MNVLLFPFSIGRCRSFNAERQKSNTSLKIQTTALEKMKIFSPFPKIVEIKLLFLDQIEVEEWEESIDLGLV